MTWAPRANLDILRQRAALLDQTRAFFRERGVLEVDTPVLQNGANLDHGVEPFAVETPQGRRFLPTSPEHPLKRLIAAGSGPVWTLAPAFRSGESGRRHRPEFRMLEWYRPGWDDLRLRDEVIELAAELTKTAPTHEVISWRDAFQRHAHCDPEQSSDADLRAALGADAGAVTSRSDALDLLLVTQVEPKLGLNTWTILTDYPASAAAQARLRRDAQGRVVAARFEIYRNGIEIANGYHECSDAAELHQRLEAERSSRSQAADLHHDQAFAAAMQAGLGDCAGVAVGFDRLVMLALGCGDIGDTMAFPFELA